MQFCRLLIFFHNHFFKQISRIPSEYQTVWIHIRRSIGPDLDLNRLQRLLAADTRS